MSQKRGKRPKGNHNNHNGRVTMRPCGNRQNPDFPRCRMTSRILKPVERDVCSWCGRGLPALKLALAG